MIKRVGLLQRRESSPNFQRRESVSNFQRRESVPNLLSFRKQHSERHSFASCAPTEPDDDDEYYNSTSSFSTSSVREKKSVHFDVGVKTRLIKDNFSFKQKDVWYSQLDLITFRAEAEQKGGIAQRKISTSNHLALALFLHACPKYKKQEALNIWASKEFRGLEEFSNPRYAKKRYDDQKLLWSAVTEAKALNANEEELREVSEQFTQHDKTFAYLMGKADEVNSPARNSQRSMTKMKSFLKKGFSFRKPKKHSSFA
eukprot:CAMPEP_0118703776 /NCGR_PEP_ID=MMETSP0800-20121206/18788_1 /TAXON_ID=210618 ORGANISM="Striatella unipunctata, Strain CCMP2910" /NCGR_SAMPLE_ID=MMETSP0800 /ASSEMBLY_ACC=CAM_ASM_000638 /LENGTH=256 /DNA_ID=CAMNT_0006605433 /DNA_START=9 /DNA_END=779 /DNA_ORIENTATION=+